MSNLATKLDHFQQRVQQQAKHAHTEEATKFALINPFIREVLGYDTADLSQVVPEYVADVGVKQGEKVDYAIMHDDQPTILIEAKKVGTPLDEEDPAQLRRYFAALEGAARFAIYTDGVIYIFYTDIDQPNVMDRQPFTTLDFRQLERDAVRSVGRFIRDEFDPSTVREAASGLKYIGLLKTQIGRLATDPAPEVVRALMSDVYAGFKTAKAVDQFTEHVKTAYASIVAEQVQDRLDAAIKVSRGDDEQTETVEPEVPNEEAMAFDTVKALIHDVIKVERLHMRAMTGYSAVLVDDTLRQPVCRLQLRARPYWIQIPEMGDGRRTYQEEQIDDVQSIYSFESMLEKVARQYIGDENETRQGAT